MCTLYNSTHNGVRRGVQSLVKSPFVFKILEVSSAHRTEAIRTVEVHKAGLMCKHRYGKRSRQPGAGVPAFFFLLAGLFELMSQVLLLLPLRWNYTEGLHG